MDPIITILPVVTNDLPISPRFTPYNFLSRCKFSTLTTRQPMFNFTYSRSHAFRYERKNTNPTLVRIELTTSALAGVQVTYYNRPLGRRTTIPVFGFSNKTIPRRLTHRPLVGLVYLMVHIVKAAIITISNLLYSILLDKIYFVRVGCLQNQVFNSLQLVLQYY